MKKVLMILGGVVVLAIVAVVVVFFVAKGKFEPYADKVLVDCRDGKIEAVYAGASEAFRKEVPLDAFRAYMATRTRALGAYKRIAKTTGGGLSASTESGSTGTLSAELEYEKGTAESEFQFVKDGGDWRLLHIKINFDEKLLPAPDVAKLEPLSRELLTLYDEAAFVALYARFSRPLQDAWKSDAYEPQIKDVAAKAGKTVKAVLRETKDEGEGRRRLFFDVTYEKGPGTAAFGWASVDGEWILIAFDMHLGGR